MNYPLLVIIVCLILFMFFQAWYLRGWERQERERYNEQVGRLEFSHNEERQEWTKERQQLLDRIQAPSYDHLKHHEVKVIKAQNNEKEPAKLEVL